MNSTLSDDLRGPGFTGWPWGPRTAAHLGVAVLGAAPLRRTQVAEVTADVVDPDHERPGARVAHDADRGRVDRDPLEVIEVGAGGVRQDRLDDVAVGHGDPGGVL